LSGGAPPSRWQRTRPWLALFLPPASWYLFEVGLSSMLKVACEPVGAGVGIAAGVMAFGLCALAAALAWPAARRADADSAARPWLAKVALLLSGIFALAIVFQTLSVLIVPPCVR